VKVKAEDYRIHNEMEEVADLVIKEILSEDSSICGCSSCQADMKSLILNRLNPQYYPILNTADERREVSLDLLDSDLFNEVLVETYRAVLKVKDKPRHDGERFYLRNSAEEIALSALNEILQGEKRTFTGNQLSTLMSLVMNNLKPLYTTTFKGSAFTRTAEVDPSYIAEVYSHIFNALKQIDSQD